MTKNLFIKPVIETSTKLKNWEVQNLFNTLSNLQPVPGIKLNYAIARTILNLKPLVKSFHQDKLIPTLPEYKKYEEELKAMYEGFAKDEKGHVKTKHSKSPSGEMVEEFDVDINAPEVVKARTELTEKHKKAIDDRKEQAKLYNEWLEQDCEEELKLHKIKREDIPESEQITKNIWVAIDLLIDDSEEVKS